MAPPASSAEPLQGQLGKGAQGSGARRPLLRAARWASMGKEARADPTFGCLPRGQGNLGRREGSDRESSGNRAADEERGGRPESPGRGAETVPKCEGPYASLGGAAGRGAGSSPVAATWPRGRWRP